MAIAAMLTLSEILPRRRFSHLFAFADWEVVEFAHPGYLEAYFEQACRSYNLTSFSPEERGESDIASYENELHEDLSAMPEERRVRYKENYIRYFVAMISANSRCASAMITGPARFNTQRNDKALSSYEKSVTAFREWRKRALDAISKAQERNKTPEEFAEEAWLKVKADIESTAETIRGIDNGTLPCMRSLIVGNLYGRLATHCNNGNVEIIDRAVALIKELNATMKKPIVTARHGIFKLPELVRKVREKLGDRQTERIRRLLLKVELSSITTMKIACKSSSMKSLTVICVPNSRVMLSSGHLAIRRGGDNSRRTL